MPDSSELKNAFVPSGDRKAWTCASLFPDERGVGHPGPARGGGVPGPPEGCDEDAAALVRSGRIRDQSFSGDVRGEVREVRPGVAGTQMIADAAGRCGPDMVRVRNGPGFDELVFGRFSRPGAGDGPFGRSAPALVSLAVFVAVASPGHVAEAGSVVPEYVYVCALPTNQALKVAAWAARIPVVLLNQNVPSVLRMS